MRRNEWDTWARLMQRPDARILRREASDKIIEDKPDLMELGSSDVNCYAVNYLESKRLEETPTGWVWNW